MKLHIKKINIDKANGMSIRYYDATKDAPIFNFIEMLYTGFSEDKVRTILMNSFCCGASMDPFFNQYEIKKTKYCFEFTDDKGNTSTHEYEINRE